MLSGVKSNFTLTLGYINNLALWYMFSFTRTEFVLLLTLSFCLFAMFIRRMDNKVHNICSLGKQLIFFLAFESQCFPREQTLTVYFFTVRIQAQELCEDHDALDDFRVCILCIWPGPNG